MYVDYISRYFRNQNLCWFIRTVRLKSTDSTVEHTCYLRLYKSINVHTYASTYVHTRFFKNTWNIYLIKYRWFSSLLLSLFTNVCLVCFIFYKRHKSWFSRQVTMWCSRESWHMCSLRRILLRGVFNIQPGICSHSFATDVKVSSLIEIEIFTAAWPQSRVDSNR